MMLYYQIDVSICCFELAEVLLTFFSFIHSHLMQMLNYSQTPTCIDTSLSADKISETDQFQAILHLLHGKTSHILTADIEIFTMGASKSEMSGTDNYRFHGLNITQTRKKMVKMLAGIVFF